MPDRFLGFFTGDTQQWLDLAAWRQIHGWDKNGTLADVQIDFDPVSLELKLKSSEPFPQEEIVNQIDTDMLGNSTGAARVPGPLADPATAQVIHVDPRKAT